MPDHSGAAASRGDARGIEENRATHTLCDEQAHWKSPLSSPDPAVVAKSLEGMEISLATPGFWGADTVLLVPAVVNAHATYEEAWERSQQADPEVDSDGRRS